MGEYGTCRSCKWWNEDTEACENEDTVFFGRYTLLGCEDWEDCYERSEEN